MIHIVQSRSGLRTQRVGRGQEEDKIRQFSHKKRKQEGNRLKNPRSPTSSEL